jgi:hypothetical protein
MKKSRYIVAGILGIVISLALFSACEINEPFPEPDATFSVWGVNPETNAYEESTEPYVLYKDVSYDYIVEGEGEQFVFWHGVAGDSTANTPKGSDFNDRGVNHLSKGMVARNNRARYAYKDVGTYTLVFVASSYSYVENEYTEMTIEKEVEVIPAPAK